MPTDVEIKKILKAQNREFKKLSKQHSEFEKRLIELERRAYITQKENLEVKRIKKQKLKIKDKMEAMIRQYRTSIGEKPN